MAIKIDRKKLLRLAAYTRPMAETRGSPWAALTLLRVVDKHLTARAFDGVRSVVAHVEMDPGEPAEFTACVGTRDLFDAAHTLPDGSISLSVSTGTVLLRNGKSERKIPHVEAHGYPTPQPVNGDLIKGVPLNALIERVFWAADPNGDGSHAWFRDIRVESDGAHVRALAMSTKGVAEHELPHDGPPGVAFIPASLAAIMRKDVDVADISDRRIVTPDADIRSALAAPWPSDRPLASEPSEARIIFDRASMVRALRSVSGFADDKDRVRFAYITVENDEATIVARGLQSTATETLMLSAPGAIDRIAIKLDVAVEVLDGWDCDEASISLNEMCVDYRPWPFNGARHAFHGKILWPESSS